MASEKTKQARRERGFTLVELLITVAVIAILVAVALPAYNNQTRKARRADAKSALMNIAAKQQQMLLDTRAYAGSVSALKVVVPASVSGFYTVSITLGTTPVPEFTATATPTGDQAQDSCGALSINQLGVKLPANCW